LEVIVDDRQASLHQGLKYSLIKQCSVHRRAVVSRQEAITDDLKEPECLLFGHVAGDITSIRSSSHLAITYIRIAAARMFIA